jgi:hypothetical protein
MKYYFLFLVFCQTYLVFGQGSNISSNESERFVKILLANKTNQAAYETLIIDALNTTGMSLDRYAQIIRSGFSGEKVVVTANEQITLDKIKSIKNQEETDQYSRLLGLCSVEKMDIKRYQDLYQRYQKDVSFQQALLPIIQSKIAEK